MEGSIEQLQGKQRRWDGDVALATIRIAFHVDPPAPPVLEAGFGSELFGTLRASSVALIRFGRSFALFCAALLPWSPLLLGGALLGRRALRRRTVRL